MASRLACACGPPLKAPGVCPASAAMSLVQPPLRASQRESHLSTSPLDLEHDLAAVLVLDLHRDHAGPPFATFLFETWLVLVLLLSGLHSGPWCQFSIVDLAPWPFQLLASQQPPHSPSLPQAGWLLSQRGGGPLLVCRNRRQGAIRSLNQTMNAALRPAGREGQRGAGGLLRAGPGRQVTRFVCLAGQEGELGPPGGLPAPVLWSSHRTWCFRSSTEGTSHRQALSECGAGDDFSGPCAPCSWSVQHARWDWGASGKSGPPLWLKAGPSKAAADAGCSNRLAAPHPPLQASPMARQTGAAQRWRAEHRTPRSPGWRPCPGRHVPSCATTS